MGEAFFFTRRNYSGVGERIFAKALATVPEPSEKWDGGLEPPVPGKDFLDILGQKRAGAE